jgi:hypothetical protein
MGRPIHENRPVLVLAPNYARDRMFHVAVILRWHPEHCCICAPPSFRCSHTNHVHVLVVKAKSEKNSYARHCQSGLNLRSHGAPLSVQGHRDSLRQS